jgi:hypothetical protein
MIPLLTFPKGHMGQLGSGNDPIVAAIIAGSRDAPVSDEMQLIRSL